MKFGFAFACATALFLTGCTYRAQTMSSPQLDVYSNYTQKVPGRWAILVDTDNLTKEVHSQDYTCSLHVYPLDIRSSFRESAVSTFQNLVQNIEVLNRPVPVQDLVKQGYAGLIYVRGEDVRTHLTFDPGFWSVKADSRVEIDVGLIVDGANGRLVGTRASGKGDAVTDAGYFCGKTTASLAQSSQAAVKDVLGVLGERFTNAPQIRSQAATGTTQQ
jgi:hypothetical protein